jgi:hypothetical protein
LAARASGNVHKVAIWRRYGDAMRSSKSSHPLNRFREQAEWCRHMATLARAAWDADRWRNYSEEWEELAEQRQSVDRGLAPVHPTQGREERGVRLNHG